MAPSKFQLPSRRAVASLALVTVVSAIEKQRKAKAEREKGSDFAAQNVQDMSGELQTIPARHGVATFVPRGRTIKIINTYGKQVVSTWAFGLGAPPEDGEDEEDAEEIEGKVDALKEELEKGEQKGEDDKPEAKDGGKEDESKDAKTKEKDKDGTNKEQGEGQAEESKEKPKEDDDDPPEQAPEDDQSSKKKNEKRTWASYLPSIPYRSKNQNQAQDKAQTKQDEKAEKAQNEATSKRWSAYLPTGKGFSSYVPNVQLPDTQGVVSAFKASNSWDPNKSYAEQLYEFSKTPVGAGTIAGMLTSPFNL